MNKLPNDYFPHDFNARSDRKVLRLRKVLGVEGYGIYWMLIETLATEENFSYPLKDIDLLADNYGTSVQKVEAVIKQFDLFQVDKQAQFFSLSLIARMQKYLEISEKARINANKRWDKARKLKEMDATALPPHNESNAIKEKDIKEYKITEGKDELIRKIWITTWGKYPTIPEYEEFETKIFDKFGHDKAKQIMRESNLKGFRKIITLIDQLDSQGNIKPRDEKEPEYYNAP